MASISMVISWSDAKISWRLTSMTCSPRFSRTSHQTSHPGGHCSRSESIWLREHHCIQSVHDNHAQCKPDWPSTVARSRGFTCDICSHVSASLIGLICDPEITRVDGSIQVWQSFNSAETRRTVYLLTYCIALWLYCFDSTWQSCISCWCFVYEGFE